MKDIKIGFLVLDSTVNNDTASTRIRVHYVTKYLKCKWVVSDVRKDLLECDVVLFQTRWTDQDLLLARELKERNIPIILDITDPEWDARYTLSTAGNFRLESMIKLADCITFSSEKLADWFNSIYPGKNVLVIRDRIDLAVHNKIRIHKDKKEKTIVWYGSWANLKSLELAREDLEKLGLEINIKLKLLYDKIGKHDIKFKNIKVEKIEWTEEKVIEALLDAELAINPKYNGDWRDYKTNNKTIKAWALGVPCVEEDFYSKIKLYLGHSGYRGEEGWKFRKEAEEKYDARLSAEELENLAWNLIENRGVSTAKANKVKNDILVYTSIIGGKDNLKENQCTKSADFVAYTDRDYPSDVWSTKRARMIFNTDCLNAKLPKVLSHEFTDGYQYSIWMDGSMMLLVPAGELIEKYMKGYDIATFKHFQRDCIYKELSIYVTLKRDFRNLIDEQRIKYRKEGIKEGSGLCECGVLIRRNSSRVEEFNNIWWAEICRYSECDQTSFIYALKRSKLRINYLPDNIYKSKYFKYEVHLKPYEPVENEAEVACKTIDIPASEIFIKRIRENDIFIVTRDGRKFSIPK
jgi:hypothetical protein